MSFAGLLDDAADRWPDRTALHFEGDRWTFQRLRSGVATAAACLARAGVGDGSRVLLLLLENCPEYLIAQFALARLGAAFVTPNPYWTRPELVRAAEAAQARAAIYAPNFSDFLTRLDMAIPVAELAASSAMPPSPAGRPDSPRYLPFSSGTTGLPKAVIHTDASLCAAVEQLRRHLALSTDDRLHIALPLCHVFSTTLSAAALSVGAEFTLSRRFRLDEALHHVRRNGVTIWPMAGAVAYELAARADLKPEDFAALRFFMWGGSAVPHELAQRISTATGVRYESPWFRWRLGLLDFDQGLVGPFRSVERGFELCGRYVVEVAVQSAGVVPMDPTQGGQLDIGDGFPRASLRRPVDEFGLVVAVDRLREGVVEAVTDGAN